MTNNPQTPDLTITPDQSPNPDMFIVIGGTGVIGNQLLKVLLQKKIFLLSFSLSPEFVGETMENINFDVDESGGCETIEKEFSKRVSDYNVVGFLDIVGSRNAVAETIAKLSSEFKFPIGIISSCLLYDHQGDTVVDEVTPTLDITSESHIYLRKKYKLEEFWKTQTEALWTIFRTHHVLGKGALLGCIPDHNRDPHLLSKMKNGEKLTLARGGDVDLSFVHPFDLAACIVEIMVNKNCLQRVVNVVHPDPVNATKYFQIIANELNVTLKVFTDFKYQDEDFWSMTAKNNTFRSRYPEVQNHKFKFSIIDCIVDALKVDHNLYPFLGEHLQKRISESD